MNRPFTKGIHGWRMSADDLKTYFGLDRTKNWPKEGCNPRTIDGYTVYVKALVPVEERTGLDPRWPRGIANPQRCMVICPVCDRHIGYGRIHQHMPVHHDLDEHDPFKGITITEGGWLKSR